MKIAELAAEIERLRIESTYLKAKLIDNMEEFINKYLAWNGHEYIGPDA